MGKARMLKNTQYPISSPVELGKNTQPRLLVGTLFRTLIKPDHHFPQAHFRIASG